MMHGKKVLVLLTESFPYGKGETFLESEVEYYSGFQKVYVVPLKIKGQLRKLPEHINVIKLQNSSKMNVSLFRGMLLQEMISMIRRKKYNENNLAMMMDFFIRAQCNSEKIYVNLLKLGISKTDQIVFYSYWLYEHALTALLLKQKFQNSTAVSRCHGYDVFEERNPGEYLPFRKLLLSKLDMIYPISRMGKVYLKEKYPSYHMRTRVRYLGTVGDQKESKDILSDKDKEILHIVSCSSLIPLKRVQMIVEVLSEIKEIPIRWTHIGDGNQIKNISMLCKTILGSNVDYQFMGQISNHEVKDFYRNEKIHLFLHMSESEGLPVSFMEAMSFGIPVISTDVGGVREIVHDKKNGFLVSSDVDAITVAELIKTIYDMTNKEYNKLRINAYQTWKLRFNASYNYTKFAQELIGITTR